MVFGTATTAKTREHSCTLLDRGGKSSQRKAQALEELCVFIALKTSKRVITRPLQIQTRYRPILSHRYRQNDNNSAHEGPEKLAVGSSLRAHVSAVPRAKPAPCKGEESVDQRLFLWIATSCTQFALWRTPQRGPPDHQCLILTGYTALGWSLVS